MNYNKLTSSLEVLSCRFSKNFPISWSACDSDETILLSSSWESCWMNKNKPKYILWKCYLEPVNFQLKCLYIIGIILTEEKNGLPMFSYIALRQFTNWEFFSSLLHSIVVKIVEKKNIFSSYYFLSDKIFVTHQIFLSYFGFQQNATFCLKKKI